MFAAAMAFGSTSVFAQVKIGTNPTIIGGTNNLEVEASTAGRKTSVDKVTGQVTIADGTQGIGRLLTSDANGGASWQSTTAIRVPETVFIGQQPSGGYAITQFTGTFDQLKDRIPLTSRAGSLPGYNATTKQYVIQESAYYRIHIGAYITGTLPLASTPNTTVALYMGTFLVLNQFEHISTATGPVLTAFWEGYMTAGTPIDVFVISFGDNQNVVVDKTFLSLTKLF